MCYIYAAYCSKQVQLKAWCFLLVFLKPSSTLPLGCISPLNSLIEGVLFNVVLWHGYPRIAALIRYTVASGHCLSLYSHVPHGHMPQF